MAPFVAEVMLKELGRCVDEGVRHLLDYEAGNHLALPEAMLSVSDGLRIAKKFNAPDRHGSKTIVTEAALNGYVAQFAAADYGKQKAERELSRTRDSAVADMWTWFNELGGYVKVPA